jgi:polar amino acid transport system substrate-binding protein
MAVATKDPATGELRGVLIDLTRPLAQRVGAPIVFVEYATNAARDAATGAWDITTGPDTPEQAAASGRAVAVPYLVADQTLVVAPASAIRTIADMDRPGVRLGAIGGSGSERNLSGLVGQAEVVRVSDEAPLVALLQTGQVEALAGNRENLLRYAAQVPGARVLADRYATQEHRLTLPPGRSAASLALASEVTRQALASGLIRASIERHGVQGIQPARAPAPGGLPQTGGPPIPLAGLAGAGLAMVAVGVLAAKGRRPQFDATD